MIRLHLQFCLTLLLLLISSQAHAENLSGFIDTKGFAYSERSNSHDPWIAGWGTLFNKWEQKLGENQLTVALRGEWMSGDEQGKLIFDPIDRHIRRPPLSVQELWLRFPLASDLDLQIGRFQLGWGKTDGYSPADAFLPRDLSDPFSDEKLPLWGVRLTGERNGLRFDALACPITTPWRLPVLGSRNAPLSAAGIPAGTKFLESDEPPTEHGFLALRLLKTSGDWDLGAWGRLGVRPAPLLDFRFDRAIPSASGPVVPIERHYAKEEAIGVELSRILGSWIVRGEAAALFSREHDLGNAIIGALSAEKGFGDGTLLITLAGNALATPVDTSLLFDRAMLPALIVAWNRTEEWGEWKGVWSTGLKHGDGLFKAELGYNMTDVWKLTLGGEVPYGSEQAPFGALQTARRVHLALRRSW